MIRLSGRSQVSIYLLEGGEHTSALDNVHGADRAPGDGGGITLGEDGDGATINHELPVSGRDLTLVLAMGRVIPEMTQVVTCSKRSVYNGTNACTSECAKATHWLIFAINSFHWLRRQRQSHVNVMWSLPPHHKS